MQLAESVLKIAAAAICVAYASSQPTDKIDAKGLQAASPPIPKRIGPVPIPPIYWPGSPENKSWVDQAIRGHQGLIDQILKLCRKAKPSDDPERCKGVLNQCRQQCTDIFVDSPDSLPGTGSNMAGRLRRCIRECMQANDCGDF
jgi:hypothetical protein